MNIYSVLLIIVFSLTINIFSQELFTAYTIIGGADGASSVHAVDLDGDGDIDVLSASFLRMTETKILHAIQLVQVRILPCLSMQ